MLLKLTVLLKPFHFVFLLFKAQKIQIQFLDDKVKMYKYPASLTVRCHVKPYLSFSVNVKACIQHLKLELPILNELYFCRVILLFTYLNLIFAAKI